ncbi:hypothetical protein HAX54_044428 [Datura stramonium]|uniref:Uncharacterized protein n=1 Tax=Datura stramonium TaxID=4076 RepID=A0ABS8SPF7_DATST|nr:hypothetical protein [Datura stramonium]
MAYGGYLVKTPVNFRRGRNNKLLLLPTTISDGTVAAVSCGLSRQPPQRRITFPLCFFTKKASRSQISPEKSASACRGKWSLLVEFCGFWSSDGFSQLFVRS